MANAPKYPYWLTDKQARVVIDALAMQARFFTKHMKTSDINYLRKVESAMRLQHDRDKILKQSCYGKLTFSCNKIERYNWGKALKQNQIRGRNEQEE